MSLSWHHSVLILHEFVHRINNRMKHLLVGRTWRSLGENSTPGIIPIASLGFVPNYNGIQLEAWPNFLIATVFVSFPCNTTSYHSIDYAYNSSSLVISIKQATSNSCGSAYLSLYLVRTFPLAIDRCITSSMLKSSVCMNGNPFRCCSIV